jgi:hypothetical protein
MTNHPHPSVWTLAAAQCQEEVLALCERERRARQAVVPSRPPHPETDHLVAESVARALTRRLADVRRTVVPLRSIDLGCR